MASDEPQTPNLESSDAKPDEQVTPKMLIDKFDEVDLLWKKQLETTRPYPNASGGLGGFKRTFVQFAIHAQLLKDFYEELQKTSSSAQSLDVTIFAKNIYQTLRLVDKDLEDLKGAIPNPNEKEQDENKKEENMETHRQLRIDAVVTLEHRIRRLHCRLFDYLSNSASDTAVLNRFENLETDDADNLTSQHTRVEKLDRFVNGLWLQTIERWEEALSDLSDNHKSEFAELCADWDEWQLQREHYRLLRTRKADERSVAKRAGGWYVGKVMNVVKGLQKAYKTMHELWSLVNNLENFAKAENLEVLRHLVRRWKIIARTEIIDTLTRALDIKNRE